MSSSPLRLRPGRPAHEETSRSAPETTRLPRSSAPAAGSIVVGIEGAMDGGLDARHDRSHDTVGRALERADGWTDEIEARAVRVSHPEHLAPRSAALDPAAGVDGTNRGEGYLQEEHRGGRVAGRRGRLLTLSTAVGGGVGGQRERHAAAGFVGGWFHGAVAGDFFDTRARDLELARRIKHRAPVTPVVVVEDPRAEHDG